ncbi:pleckstrin homology (PH) domain-containing protein [Actinidia rufa]|uniref:Pleckstrin homology (PH) domain-containing protein n=1 Tax=Actinidia rufa TaxID=165716 RepID=A0A7J0HDC0_9ERIC|nr:pleckstrin homology (PH) domain-containing protein [Actinidia rufa]
MLEDQVAYLLQRYLGNYVRGLNKETLKISVWKGYFMQDQRSIGDSGPCVKSSVLNPPAFAQPEVILFSRSHSCGK